MTSKRGPKGGCPKGRPLASRTRAGVKNSDARGAAEAVKALVDPVGTPISHAPLKKIKKYRGVRSIRQQALTRQLLLQLAGVANDALDRLRDLGGRQGRPARNQPKGLAGDNVPR